MNHNFQITRLSQDDVQIVLNWAAKEGWNPGLNDANCFYQADPNGFFAGHLDGKIIAVGSAVIYDKYFAFCGCYIVDKAYRGQGFGLALTKERLRYIGKRNAGIDGVPEMLDKYERLGYRIAHKNIRFESRQNFPFESNSKIVALKKINFTALKHFDRRHFPAPRDAFLTCWINQFKANGLAYLDNETLRGYGVIRPCLKGFKIGPLFAETPIIANALFKALAHHANGDTYYLDVPANNPNALNLINTHEFEKSFETARMYLHKVPDIEQNNVYGITTFELG